MKNEYILPQPVYKQAFYAVKDLERLYEKQAGIIGNASAIASVSADHMYSCSSGMVITDNTARYALSLASTSNKIRAIEEAFMEIPEKYRLGIREKIVNNVPYDDRCCMNTWKKWQQVLVYYVAVNLGLI